jgi:hypothetical protein
MALPRMSLSKRFTSMDLKMQRALPISRQALDGQGTVSRQV